MSEYIHAPVDDADIPRYLEDELVRIEEHINRNIWEHSFKSYTASATIGESPYSFGDATSGAITFTLPEPSDAPMILNVLKSDSSANEVIVAATSINGQATQSIYCQYGSLTLYWNQTEWFIV